MHFYLCVYYFIIKSLNLYQVSLPCLLVSESKHHPRQTKLNETKNHKATKKNRDEKTWEAFMHRRKSCLFGKMLYQQLWPSVPHPFSSQGGLGIAQYTNTIPSLEVAAERTEMTV